MTTDMIDQQGYRLNVGIVLANKNGQLFLGKRSKIGGWQFPQGGVKPYETLEETMYRELTEEIGLIKEQIKILATTKNWIPYTLPKHMRTRTTKNPKCIGQKQKWFLLLLTADDKKIDLNCSQNPEFSDWHWVDYWEPLKRVIYFKRSTYLQVLKEFEPKLQQEIKPA